MKRNKLIVVALGAVLAATTALLTSCTKSIEGGDDTGTPDADIAVRIAIGGAKTRSAATPVDDGTAVAFTSGWLIFTDSGTEPTPTMVVEVTDTNDPFVGTTNPKTVGIEQLKAEPHGAMITGIPAISSRVELIGNSHERELSPDRFVGNESYRDMLAENAFDQYNSITDGTREKGDVSNVTCWGEGTFTKIPGTDDYVANVDVKPICARFEIGNIVGHHSAGGSFSYKVAGIIMDRWCTDIYLGGNGDYRPRNLDAYDSEVPFFFSAPQWIRVYFGPNGQLYDYNLTTGVATPGEDKVWAYNLLVPTPYLSGPGDSRSTMPSVVIQIIEVEVDGIPWPGVSGDEFGTIRPGTTYNGDGTVFAPGAYYLTISNFFEKDAGGNKGAKITDLERGCIYSLGDINFTEKNLTLAPYAKIESVEVKVKMMKWATTPTEVDFE